MWYLTFQLSFPSNPLDLHLSNVCHYFSLGFFAVVQSPLNSEHAIEIAHYDPLCLGFCVPETSLFTANSN